MTALMIAALVLLQIYLGALVAGLDAGMSFNTWPLIDGTFIPSSARLWHESPWWRNLFESVLTVQFDHRMLAYAIWLLVLFHAADAARTDAETRGGAFVLALLITAQAVLGIVTLLYVAPLPLALAHQAFAIVVLTFAVVHAEYFSRGAPLRTRVGEGP
jgi:cytochrome c oxidase assembly protein subunit 15